MKTIIFPTDFSDEAARGLPIAAQLARLYQARLELVHVESPIADYSPSLSDSQYVLTQVHNQVQRAFDELLLHPCLQGIRVNTHMVWGTSLTDLFTHETFAKADLLVMTSTGASGWKEVFLGSNAEHIIREAPMPVLVLKDAPRYLDMKTVVFASDFQGDYTASMDVLKELLDGFDYPTVHLLYVNTMSHFVPTQTIRPRMEAFVDQYGVGGWQIVQEDAFDVETALLDVAHRYRSDLIVLATHRRRGLHHLLEGSIAENVTNHAPIPVLTLPLQTQPVSQAALIH